MIFFDVDLSFIKSSCSMALHNVGACFKHDFCDFAQIANKIRSIGLCISIQMLHPHSSSARENEALAFWVIYQSNVDGFCSNISSRETAVRVTVSYSDTFVDP